MKSSKDSRKKKPLHSPIPEEEPRGLATLPEALRISQEGGKAALLKAIL